MFIYQSIQAVWTISFVIQQNLTSDAQFGATLCLFGRYLTIGASGANTAFSYEMDEDGKWIEVQKVDPVGQIKTDILNFGASVTAGIQL